MQLMTSIQDILIDNGFEQIGTSIFQKRINGSFRSWVYADKGNNNINYSFGFIRPDVNRFAFKVLIDSLDGSYRPQYPATAGPLILINAHLYSKCSDVDSAVRSLYLLLSSEIKDFSLREIVSYITYRNIFLESYPIIIPAALVMLGDVTQAVERARVYMSRELGDETRRVYESYYGKMLPGFTC